MAGLLLRDAGQLAQGIEDVASDLARMALTETRAPLPDISAEADRFSPAFYAALRAVLARLDALPAHVSEPAIRHACAARSGEPGQTPADRAAALSLALRQARVLRGATLHATTPLPESQLEGLAIFAVMLCLLADRSEGEEDQALASATDLALALGPEVAAAFDAPDPVALSELYAKYARHV